MRSLLKKIERGRDLSGDEYEQLLRYIEQLGLTSPEAYAVFYDQYAALLYDHYDTFIPRFSMGRDDFFDYLLSHPDLLKPGHRLLPLDAFPSRFHPYLEYTFGPNIPVQSLGPVTELAQQGLNNLPAPRSGSAVLKYEEANPYKEPGLKTHFERLARYAFITRVQSYRYLTRRKSSSDRIEYILPDCLGGIFTNKQKSIYYYLFLSEADAVKAQNACNLLNLILYNREQL
jgi:hypothetical protein